MPKFEPTGSQNGDRIISTNQGQDPSLPTHPTATNHYSSHQHFNRWGSNSSHQPPPNNQASSEPTPIISTNGSQLNSSTSNSTNHIGNIISLNNPSHMTLEDIITHFEDGEHAAVKGVKEQDSNLRPSTNILRATRVSNGFIRPMNSPNLLVGNPLLRLGKEVESKRVDSCNRDLNSDSGVKRDESTFEGITFEIVSDSDGTSTPPLPTSMSSQSIPTKIQTYASTLKELSALTTSVARTKHSINHRNALRAPIAVNGNYSGIHDPDEPIKNGNFEDNDSSSDSGKLGAPSGETRKCIGHESPLFVTAPVGNHVKSPVNLTEVGNHRDSRGKSPMQRSSVIGAETGSNSKAQSKSDDYKPETGCAMNRRKRKSLPVKVTMFDEEETSDSDDEVVCLGSLVPEPTNKRRKSAEDIKPILPERRLGIPRRQPISPERSPKKTERRKSSPGPQTQPSGEVEIDIQWCRDSVDVLTLSPDSAPEPVRKKRHRRTKLEMELARRSLPLDVKPNPIKPIFNHNMFNKIKLNIKPVVERESALAPKRVNGELSPGRQKAAKKVGYVFSANYDMKNRDVTWVCAFCHGGSNAGRLGDLFGPFLVERRAGSPSRELETSSSTSVGSRPGTSGKQQGARAGSPAKDNTRQECWVHEDCFIWSHGTYLVGTRLVGLEDAINHASETVCSKCKDTGASLGCLHKGCTEHFHFACAVKRNCQLMDENFSMLCHKHMKRKNIRVQKDDE